MNFILKVKRSTKLTKIYTNIIYLLLTKLSIISFLLFFNSLRYNKISI